MTRWRIWRRFMLLALAGALVWCLAAGLATWRMQHEVARAQSEIGAGRVEPARRRLAALAASHPGALGGAVDYLLGVCEATGGRGLRTGLGLGRGLPHQPRRRRRGRRHGGSPFAQLRSG
jgi:hypothetical protein